MKLNYLVTGTGRCGTVFMARLLTSVGILCGHEMIFNYDGLEAAKRRLRGEEPFETSWASRSKFEDGTGVEIEKWLPDGEIEAESSYLAAPFLKDEILKDATVIHLVRDPAKVVNSFCNYIHSFVNKAAKNSYEDFIYSRVPECRKVMPNYDRAAIYWVRWNQMIERSKPKLFHRIEDGPQKVLDFLGKSGPHFNDTTVNTFKRTTTDKFTPKKIESKVILDEFLAMGKRYGYSMISDYLMI
jgi:hypothetical protein